jgi:hypothetical protein
MGYILSGLGRDRADQDVEALLPQPLQRLASKRRAGMRSEALHPAGIQAHTRGKYGLLVKWNPDYVFCLTRNF